MGVKIYQVIIVVLAFACYHFWQKSKEFEVTSEGEKSAYNSLVEDLKLDIQIQKVKAARYMHEADSINQLFIQSQKGHETDYKEFRQRVTNYRALPLNEQIRIHQQYLDSPDSVWIGDR